MAVLYHGDGGISLNFWYKCSARDKNVFIQWDLKRKRESDGSANKKKESTRSKLAKTGYKNLWLILV